MASFSVLSQFLVFIYLISAHCITMYFYIQIPNISDCWLLFLNKLHNTFSRQVQSFFPLLHHLHQILLFLLRLHKPSANLFQIIPRILCHPPNWAPSLLCSPFCTPHEVPLQFQILKSETFSIITPAMPRRYDLSPWLAFKALCSSLTFEPYLSPFISTSAVFWSVSVTHHSQIVCC